MPKLRFSVDSALLSELGEKLVESVHLALLELVKNAYDADATHVLVKMILQDGDYEIHVIDNGVGMTLDDVKRYWMRIATTNKADDDTSGLFGRRKSGSKGIGRFSCRRLGSRLSLRTTAQLANGQYETSRLTISWDDYSPGSDVDKIECEGNSTRSSTGEMGTELEITGGKPDEWTQGGWRVLKRRLMLLVSNRGTRRKGYRNDPGFNVSLESPGFEEAEVVDQREQLMDAGWGRLTLKVDSRGKAHWELVAKRIGRKQLIMSERYPDICGTTADIAILPDKKSQFRDPKAVSIIDLRPALEEWGGVHVRVRGIRVYPFGERRDDWLLIDRDRGIRKGSIDYEPIAALAARLRGVEPTRALLNMLSARSYVGEVNAESPAGLFEMKASREGFVGEGGIEALRKVIRVGIDWSTVYRDSYLRREEQEEARDARKQFETVVATPTRPQHVIEDAVDYVQKEVRHIAAQLPLEQRREVVSGITKAISAVRETTKVNRDELQHLRLVASTSSLLLIFSHEVKSLLGLLDEYEMRLAAFARQLTGRSASQAKDMQESFRSTKQRFLDLLKMTSLFSVESRDAEPTKLNLATRAKNAVKCFQLITGKYGIDVDLSGIPNSLQVGPMLEAELYSLLLNALSNSIKSVIARGYDKHIAIRAQRVSSGIQMNVLDTGVGVPDDCEELFDPFIADPEGTFYRRLKKCLNPEDSYIVGTGSGLGLSIVREIVEAHDGTVGFAEEFDNWQANLEVVMP
ncbi:MAG: sensor histidine kinase [Planctomycetia bacterium]|nr:sensor histidine kinase [Planctomycetia bacterium]